MAKQIKIMLDAGHYGKYNRSPAYPEYWESLQMWALHLLLKSELKKYGFIVGVTRFDQKRDLDPYDRGVMAKGYDAIFSLHSNAVGSYRSDAIDYAIVYMLNSDSKGEKLADTLTTQIARTMNLKQGGRIGTRLQSNGREYYGVLRGAKAVGCPHAFIIEHSFHTAYKPSVWLMNEANLKKLAIVEAEKIAEFYGVKKEEKELTEAEVKALIEASKEKVYHYWSEIEKLPGDMYPALRAMYKAGFFKGASTSDLNISQTKLECLVVLARTFKAAGILKY